MTGHRWSTSVGVIARRKAFALVLSVVALISMVLGVHGSAAAAVPGKGGAGESCEQLRQLNVSWWYNWMYAPNGCDVPGFVPMVSGKDKQGDGDIKWVVDQITNAGYEQMLGFNEPDIASQSPMTVERALQLWPILTANPSIKVGSPATSSGGKAWMRAFMEGVESRGLRVDFVAAHWYGWNSGECNAAYLDGYLNFIKSIAGGRDVWLTEYGCLHQSNTDRSTVIQFYTDAQKVFDRHPEVKRQAWYPYIENHGLFGSSGKINGLGKLYRRRA